MRPHSKAKDNPSQRKLMILRIEQGWSAAEAFGSRAPGIHLPLGLVAAAASLKGAVAKLRGRIPDLELDAVRLLREDYIVDNSKLRATGYALLYPDFRASMQEIGRTCRS